MIWLISVKIRVSFGEKNKKVLTKKRKHYLKPEKSLLILKIIDNILSRKINTPLKEASEDTSQKYYCATILSWLPPA